MSKVNVNTIEPSTGTDITLGASGDTITVPSGATFTQSGTMNASAITAGTLATARGGTGTTSYTAGITEADTWRITASFDGSADPITANWERDDSYGNGLLGTGMSESSGIFSFPSTGFWTVPTYSLCNGIGDTDNYPGLFTYYTPDNSDWSAIATNGYGYVIVGSYNGNVTEKIFDITDVSNQKVRFRTETQRTTTRWTGNTNINHNYVVFVRLGDT